MTARQPPLFDGVEPKKLPPLPDPPEVPSCPMCGAVLDAEARCGRCSR